MDIPSPRSGKLKVYIGMSAGVGKTYRMLQEAHSLLRQGVHVQIGLVETHGRRETEALLAGLPQIPLREAFYRGKKLMELDVNAILLLRPEWVLVDELAHTNIPGSRNEKRWQDVLQLIEAGINVITAVNIQHIESINDEVQRITGVEIRERVPDRLLRMADEVVNIDLTADELITRMREGKIYETAKVETALRNFFQPEKILQLRELALKEVASQVERKVESEVARPQQLRHERLMACISSRPEAARRIIRKTSRLAGYYNARWYVLYVQTPAEAPDTIPLDLQRHLINNFKLATELGAEVLNVPVSDRAGVAATILEVVEKQQITTLCIGKPRLRWWEWLVRPGQFGRLMQRLSDSPVDMVVFSDYPQSDLP